MREGDRSVINLMLLFGLPVHYLRKGFKARCVFGNNNYQNQLLSEFEIRTMFPPSFFFMSDILNSGQGVCSHARSEITTWIDRTKKKKKGHSICPSIPQ